jgi:hypothetical protein
MILNEISNTDVAPYNHGFDGYRETNFSILTFLQKRTTLSIVCNNFVRM